MKAFFLPSFLCISCLFSALSLQAQWIRQYPLPKLEDVLDIDMSNDGYGFAAGSNDLLLRSIAGDGTWELLPGFGEHWKFEAVDYFDGSGGSVAAAGGDGLIITVDKGNHWNAVSDAPAGIHTIRVFSPTHLIVAGDDGVYEWENDTWTDLELPLAGTLRGAFILDEQHIWAYTFATDPTIYYTSDGGSTWDTNAEIPRVDVLRFYDSENGIVANGKDVYTSTNGGANWTLLAANTLKNVPNDISYGTSSNILMAATPNAKPNISTDGGLTWTALTNPLINQRSYSIAATSDTDFWIGNDLTGIMHSSDSGVNWEETSGPTRNIIQDVYFVNRTTGFAIGQKGLILRTTDGGLNWDDISTGTLSYLSVHGLNANDMWIGTNQRILHSTDEGDTWTDAVVFPAGSGNINDVLAISSSRILAVSTTGSIYLSTDGGVVWNSVYTSGMQMRSVSKIDDQHYMATGFNGVIVRSDDQGATWNPVTIPEAGLQYEQSYFINGEGYLITSSFKKAMWHTTNNGATWDTLALPIDRFWDGLYFITPDTGVIVGRSGTEGRTYITFDGGHHWQSGYITTYPMYGVTGVPNPNGTAWIFGYGSDIENLPNCNALPLISDFVGELFPCEKDTVEYSISSQDVESFTWRFPPGWQIVGNADNDTVRVVIGQNAGNITVSGENVCGVTGQQVFSATAHRLPVLQNISGEPSPCQGNIEMYHATALNSMNYVWTVPSDWSIQGNSDQPDIQVLVGTANGALTVISSNICGVSEEKILPVQTSTVPTINSVAGDVNPCRGDTVTYVMDPPNGIYNISSFEGLGDWSGVQGTFTFIAGNDSGKIFFTSLNECGTSAPFELDLEPTYVPDFTINNSGTKLFPTVTGESYEWYLNDVQISGATHDTIVPTLSGTYTVKVTFGTGCSWISFPVEVVISGTHIIDSFKSLKVYPIPTTDELILSEINGSFDYSIENMTGYRFIANHQDMNKINVSSLTSGVYVLRVLQGNNFYLSRFIKI